MRTGLLAGVLVLLLGRVPIGLFSAPFASGSLLGRTLQALFPA